MKVTLSRQSISIGLIAIGIINLIIATAVSLSDLTTVYKLTGSIDVQDNSEIVRQLNDIEMRTQIYNIMKIVGVLVAIMGAVLLYISKRRRTDHHPRA